MSGVGEKMTPTSHYAKHSCAGNININLVCYLILSQALYRYNDDSFSDIHDWICFKEIFLDIKGVFKTTESLISSSIWIFLTDPMKLLEAYCFF